MGHQVKGAGTQATGQSQGVHPAHEAPAHTHCVLTVLGLFYAALLTNVPLCAVIHLAPASPANGVRPSQTQSMPKLSTGPSTAARAKYIANEYNAPTWLDFRGRCWRPHTNVVYRGVMYVACDVWRSVMCREA